MTRIKGTHTKLSEGLLMRITDVKATTIRVPLETSFGGSVYQVGYRVTTITQVHTDQGIVSATYSGDDRWTYQQMHEYVVGPLRTL